MFFFSDLETWRHGDTQPEHPPVSCCFPVSLVWWEGSISSFTSSVVLTKSCVASRTVQCSVDVPSMDSRWSPVCNAPHLVKQSEQGENGASLITAKHKITAQMVSLFWDIVRTRLGYTWLAQVSVPYSRSAWCLCISYCGSNLKKKKEKWICIHVGMSSDRTWTSSVNLFSWLRLF